MRNRRLCPLVRVNMHCRVTINLTAFTPQERVQPPVTKELSRLYQFLQPLTQGTVILSEHLVAIRQQPIARHARRSLIPWPPQYARPLAASQRASSIVSEQIFQRRIIEHGVGQ